VCVCACECVCVCSCVYVRIRAYACAGVHACREGKRETDRQRENETEIVR